MSPPSQSQIGACTEICQVVIGAFRVNNGEKKHAQFLLSQWAIDTPLYLPTSYFNKYLHFYKITKRHIFVFDIILSM